MVIGGWLLDQDSSLPRIDLTHQLFVALEDLLSSIAYNDVIIRTNVSFCMSKTSSVAVDRHGKKSLFIHQS